MNNGNTLIPAPFAGEPHCVFIDYASAVFLYTPDRIFISVDLPGTILSL